MSLFHNKALYKAYYECVCLANLIAKAFITLAVICNALIKSLLIH